MSSASSTDRRGRGRRAILAIALAALPGQGACVLDASLKHACQVDEDCDEGRSCLANVCTDDPSRGHELMTGAPNYVFVTSRTFAPIFASLDEADGHCRDAAASAGLPGAFRAWLSTTATNARDRLAGARGWIRPDGAPFVDTREDLLGGKIFSPALLDEHGREVRGTAHPVVTGTTASGVLALGANCNDWRDGAGTATAGTNEGTTTIWTDFSRVPCDAMARLICFGTDQGARVAPPPNQGKLVFLSDDVFDPTRGVEGADQQCGAEAFDAGFHGVFMALLSTSTRPLAGSLPILLLRAWFRPDGVAVDGIGGNLPYSAALLAPINVTSRKVYLGDVSVFTGAPDDPSGPNLDPTQTCADWRGGVTARTGTAANTSTWLGSHADPVDCRDGGHRIYCLEE
jgi:hypothetical protein